MITMRASIATICLLAGAMLAGGCATKKYVRNTTAPVQAKVDQVGEQSNQNSQRIQDTRNEVKAVDEKAQSGISAAQERANSADQHAATADQHATAADQHAGEAMNRANQADQKTDKNTQEIGALRNAVTNIDDFKLQTSATVPFAFDKAVLSKQAKADLDKLAADLAANKRYFVAVEGYTDATGSKSYNESLSKRRADAVVSYLVSKDVPFFKIHQIGMGQEKPVDDAKGRSARAKNRRVEVKVFTADQVTASLGANASTSANRDR
jgi:outer membrane protein OmpA-like peptidoglycan-associated protein